VKRILILLAGLALGGCAMGGAAGFRQPVTGGGGGLPATMARASTAVVTPPGRGLAGLAVRTYTRDAAGAVTEVPATCTISAGAFGARMATPGRLVIPDLGPDAPAVTALCSAPGLAGQNSVEPAYRWARTGGTPPERVLWGNGWWWGGFKTGPMRYPDLDVGLVPRS
jgi:hypothetical protein